jgi:hypothetical protein
LLVVAIMVTSPECTLYSNLYIQLRENAVVSIHTPVPWGYNTAVIVAVALQQNSSLLELRIWIEIEIFFSGIAAIAEVLKLNTSLQRLKLKWNRIGDSGAAAIAEALKLNTSLQRLNLDGNEIGDSGATAIAEALTLNASLQELSLYKNEIGDSGAAAIAEALKRNTSLQRLILDSNEIGDYGAATIAEALKLNTSLQLLDLYGNKIEDSGAVAIVEAVMLSSSVRELDLGHNTFGYGIAAEALEFLLARQHVNPRPIHVKFFYGLAVKVCFFEFLLSKGFTTFLVDTVPPALLPHALAMVRNYPSLLLHLVRQMVGVQVGEFSAWS